VPLLTLALIPVNRRRGDLEYARERPAGEAQALEEWRKWRAAKAKLEFEQISRRVSNGRSEEYCGGARPSANVSLGSIILHYPNLSSSSLIPWQRLDPGTDGRPRVGRCPISDLAKPP